jgi:two-component system, sensor histidine kinase and response regulator
MPKPASILIVDDEFANFEVIEILLFKQAYNLSYVSNGTDALKELDEQHPDLILLDVMMPDLDGIEVCRQIKTHPTWQHIPVIMVTALNSKEDLSRCLDAGADDFVGKPVSGLELRARVQSMLRIKQQYDALQSVLQLRDDMANMVIHDLRNPIANIFLACRVLQLHSLNEKQQQKLEQVLYAGRRLESLIDSLLTIAKLDSGKLVLNLTDVDFYEMGQSAIADFTEMAKQQQIALCCDLPEPGHQVSVDVILIRRVLDNLLSNALKFSFPNTQIWLKIDYPQHTRVRIQVKDAGQGISEETQQRLFQKFEVGEIKQNVRQTGLGLAFCQMAVSAHNGQILIESNQPKGTIFTVEL